MQKDKEFEIYVKKLEVLIDSALDLLKVLNKDDLQCLDKIVNNYTDEPVITCCECGDAIIAHGRVNEEVKCWNCHRKTYKKGS